MNYLSSKCISAAAVLVLLACGSEERAQGQTTTTLNLTYEVDVTYKPDLPGGTSGTVQSIPTYEDTRLTEDSAPGGDKKAMIFLSHRVYDDLNELASPPPAAPAAPASAKATNAPANPPLSIQVSDALPVKPGSFTYAAQRALYDRLGAPHNWLIGTPSFTTQPAGNGLMKGTLHFAITNIPRADDLHIHISTSNSSKGPVLNDNFTLKDLLNTYDLPINNPDAPTLIRFSITYSDQDIADYKADKTAAMNDYTADPARIKSEYQAELRKAATRIYVGLQAQGCDANEPLLFQFSTPSINLILKNLFFNSQVAAKSNSPALPVTISVSNLSLTSKVSLKVAESLTTTPPPDASKKPEATPTQTTPPPDVLTPEDAKQFQSYFDGIYTGKELDASPATYVTSKAVTADQNHLGQDSKVSKVGASVPDNDPHVLEYRIVPYNHLIQDIDTTVSAQYSPSRSFSGKLSLSESNLISSQQGGLGETTSASYEYGARVNTGTFDFKLPALLTTNHQVAGPQFDLSADRDQNNDYLVGSTHAPHLDATISHVGASCTWRFDSFSQQDYYNQSEILLRNRPVQFVTDLVAGYEFTNFGVTQTGTCLNEGDLAGPFSQIKERVIFDTQHYNQTSGLGDIDLDSALEGHLSNKDLGGDYNCVSTQGDLAVEIPFGFSSTQDFIARQTIGGCYASSLLPTFNLYRIGGTGSLPGLEEGEFLAKDLVYGRTEFGASAAYLFPGLLPSVPAGGGAPASGGIDFHNVYLTGFVDVGYTDYRDYGSGTIKSRSLTDFGLQIELAKINAGGTPLRFDAGYAYSPDSVLHKTGTFYSAAVVQF